MSLKKWMASAALLLLTRLAFAQAAASPAGEIAWVLASTANVRHAAASDAKKVATLTIGTRVRVLESRQGWSRIRLGARTGWVSASLLSSKPVEIESVLGSFRASKSPEEKRRWAERAAALDQQDPRALAALVAALRTVEDEVALSKALDAVQTYYERRLGGTEHRRDVVATFLAQTAGDATPGWPEVFERWLAVAKLEELIGRSLFDAEITRTVLRDGRVETARPFHIDFIRVVGNTIHLPRNAAQRLQAQALYEQRVRKVARNLFFSLLRVQGMSAADLHMSLGGGSYRGKSLSPWSNLTAALDAYERIEGSGFWVRRFSEGTAEETAAGLEKLMVLYDPEILVQPRPRRSKAGEPWQYFPPLEMPNPGLVVLGSTFEDSDPLPLGGDAFAVIRGGTALREVRYVHNPSDLGFSGHVVGRDGERLAPPRSARYALFGDFEAGPMTHVVLQPEAKRQTHRFGDKQLLLRRRVAGKVKHVASCSNGLAEAYGEEMIPDRWEGIYDYDVVVDGVVRGTVRRVPNLHLCADFNRDGWPDVIAPGPLEPGTVVGELSMELVLYLSDPDGRLRESARFTAGMPCGC